MFDIGFWELLLLSALALLVLGPERMPDAALRISALLKRMRRSVASFQHELHEQVRASKEKSLDENLEHLDQLFAQAPDKTGAHPPQKPTGQPTGQPMGRQGDPDDAKPRGS